MTDQPTTDLPTSRRPDPHTVVLFGATGDLAARKLIPGFLRLQSVGLMPEDYRIIGTARRPMTDEEFRAHARDVVDRFGRAAPSDDDWDRFAQRLSFVSSDVDRMDDLAAAVRADGATLGDASRVLAYLSVPPVAMGGIVSGLGSVGLGEARTRVILEKPFGTDVDSAKALNATLHGVFAEEQIFRIDHFLGKEDVQNILAVRFGNQLFEPMWCAVHVESIQIDVPETLGVENRAGFYEQTGAFRDMVVTHLFQALGFLAMERPAEFSADALAEEKQRVFAALQPVDPARVVRGQYAGYRDLPKVADDSDTETMVALEVTIDNDRWAGVPILLRTGKELPEGRRVITLRLRQPEMEIFPRDGRPHGNEIVFEIAEPGGIRINFLSKEPGPSMVLGPAHLDLDYKSSFDPRCELEAYERLLHDAMLGDRTLFNRAEGIERLWEVAAPLLADPPPVQPYERGTWGPDAAVGLAGPAGWHLPEQPG